MSGNSTSLYSSSTSNITLSSNNFTTLYPGGSGTVTPAQPYGNANVVGLLAAGTDGANTVANVIATGNITGNYFVGNGSQLTGILGTYSNAQVAAYLASGTVTSNIITSANVSGNYILGNGSQLTGLPVQYGNANVANFLASGNNSSNIITSANVTGAFLTTAGASGNISGVDYVNANLYLGNGSLLTGITAVSSNTAVTVTGNAQPNITSVGTLTSITSTGNVTGGNILTGGVVSATGNVTGNYLLGNGAFISGLPAGYSNADVATFLANFGSNSISTTGNVTAGYLIGNGSLLSSITGANVTGTVANATFATSAGTAVTVTGNAQANITSVGTLTSLSVSGNTTTGNLLTGGEVSATGNITGNYIIGNGSLLTAITGANVTGTVANATFATSAGTAGSANTAVTVTGNAQANITSVGTLTSLIVDVGGISASGNITAPFFQGNGSALTGLPTQVGGSNTQIQFNDNGDFGGNSIMTFEQTTGNVQLSNVIISQGGGTAATGLNAQRINTTTAYTGTSLTTNGFESGQIVIGNGFFGNLNLLNIQARPAAKFNIWDSANVTEVSGNSLRYQALNSTGMISIGNIANTASLVRGGIGTLAIGGGFSANSWTTTNQGMGAVLAFNQFLAVGQPNTVAALGNVTLTGAAAALGQHFVYAGSNVGNAGGLLAQISAAGNVTTGIGMMPSFAGTPSTTPTNTIGYYMPGTTNTFGSTNSNGFRQATNYYFLRNDDNVAQNQLGSLRAYHTFQAGGNTTGTWDINKQNGQVQAISATGNITIGSYTNFVTTANDGTNNDNQTDTVTLIIEQGATPYTVTMPTGNASIRYASGNSTVPATANSTTTISIQAYRSAANATAYITTISPAAT